MYFQISLKIDWVQSHFSESISLLLGTNSCYPCESLGINSNFPAK